MGVAVIAALPECVRALLRKGHDADGRFPVSWVLDDRFTGTVASITPAAACVMVGPWHPARLECLEILVKEGGAGLSKRGPLCRSILHQLALTTEHPAPDAAVSFVLGLGADLEAHGALDEAPLHECAGCGDLKMLEALRARGACLDVFERSLNAPLCDAITPKMSAPTRRPHDLVGGSWCSARRA